MVQINEVLAIKHDWIIIADNKKKFTEANTCWSCKGKFAIDRKEVACFDKNKDYINTKIKKEAKDAEEHKSLTTSLLKIIKEIDVLETKNDKVWNHYHITGKF